MKQHHSCAGFTLIELLVAITITAVLGIGAALTLNTGILTKETVELRAQVFQSVQKSQRTIANDFRQAVARSARDEFGDRLYAYTNLNTLTLVEFTRAGWRDPQSFLAGFNPELEIQPRSSLQRVVYELEDDTLYRYYWQVVDRAQDSEPVRQKLLEDVKSIELRFLDEDNEWTDQWPSSKLLDNEAIDAFDILPRAVEMTLDHFIYGMLRRVHLLAGWNIHNISLNEANDRRKQGGRSSGSGRSNQSEINEQEEPEEDDGNNPV